VLSDALSSTFSMHLMAMSRLLILPSILILGLLLAACAPTGEATHQSARGPITTAEIDGSNLSGSALDLVRSLRPEWLNIRGRTDVRSLDQDGIRIYYNGTRFGDDFGALQDISLQNVARVERLTSREATVRYGPGHFQGAIVVVGR
jgi:hypothetical protein